MAVASLLLCNDSTVKPPSLIAESWTRSSSSRCDLASRQGLRHTWLGRVVPDWGRGRASSEGEAVEGSGQGHAGGAAERGAKGPQQRTLRALQAKAEGWQQGQDLVVLAGPGARAGGYKGYGYARADPGTLLPGAGGYKGYGYANLARLAPGAGRPNSKSMPRVTRNRYLIGAR